VVLDATQAGAPGRRVESRDNYARGSSRLGLPTTRGAELSDPGWFFGAKVCAAPIDTDTPETAVLGLTPELPKRQQESPSRMTNEAQKRETPGRRSGICTLFEGDYHIGLAAFLNSLAHAGYAGTVWVGYRGPLPPWLNQLRRTTQEAHEYEIAGQIQLVFLPVETQIHLTNYKPWLMLDLLAGAAHDCDFLWYFDPDIFLRAPWTFFANWQRYGIALCQEIVNNNLPADAPLRHEWMEAASRLGLSNPRPLDRYYNGGLVGIPRDHAHFLVIWRRLIEHAGEVGYDLTGMMPGTRDMPFHASDQDALNIAAMYSEFPLSTLGPQGMGFIPGDVKMFHTVGVKPWKGSFLLRAIAGKPPSDAMKYFLTQLSSPIRPYSPLGLRAKKLACSVAALIGRFYRRR